MNTSTLMRLIGAVLATGAGAGIAAALALVAGSGALRRHRRHALDATRPAAEGV